MTDEWRLRGFDSPEAYAAHKAEWDAKWALMSVSAETWWALERQRREAQNVQRWEPADPRPEDITGPLAEFIEPALKSAAGDAAARAIDKLRATEAQRAKALEMAVSLSKPGASPSEVTREAEKYGRYLAAGTVDQW